MTDVHPWFSADRLDLDALPLDAPWAARLDELALSRGLPRCGVGLAPALREVSEAYNAANFRLPWTKERLAARLHFFLPRDQAKVGAALRDVPLDPSWREGTAPLRLVDVGAGLGASTLGAVRALRARGVTRPIEATLLDVDAAALAVAAEVLGVVPGVKVQVGAAPRGAEAAPAPDLVLFAQVLVELPSEAEAADRLRVAAAGLAPGGRVVVVEPALHGATRRLMRIRDVVAGAAEIVAPCPHAGRCAMLDQPRDWCHDDLDVDLPPWLHPLARAAGLRWQGLTFARLVLANEPVARPPLRVVAPPRDTRGRKERQLCGTFPDGTTLRWVDRLDKRATEANTAFADLARGDGVLLEPVAARVEAETLVVRG